MLFFVVRSLWRFCRTLLFSESELCISQNWLCLIHRETERNPCHVPQLCIFHSLVGDILLAGGILCRDWHHVYPPSFPLRSSMALLRYWSRNCIRTQDSCFLQLPELWVPLQWMSQLRIWGQHGVCHLYRQLCLHWHRRTTGKLARVVSFSTRRGRCGSCRKSKSLQRSEPNQRLVDTLDWED